MPTRLILIRHGETPLNIRKAYYGLTNVKLNKRGIAQAKRLIPRLNKERVYRVYSSDLKRAFDFAGIIFKEKTIEKSPDLRELNLGIFEGLTHKQLLKKYPLIYANWLGDPFAVVIPEGDSLCDFRKRIKNFLKKIVSLNSGRTVAVVTHAGPIRIILNDIWKSKDIWSIKVDLASITIIKYEANKASVESLNDTSYRGYG